MTIKIQGHVTLEGNMTFEPGVNLAGGYTALMFGFDLGLDGGIYKTTDSSETYSVSLDGTLSGSNPQSNITVAAVNGSTVVALSRDIADNNDGIYVSTDTGDSFTHVPNSGTVPITRGQNARPVGFISGKFCVVSIEANDDKPQYWDSADGFTWTFHGEITGNERPANVFNILEFQGDIFMSTFTLNVDGAEIFKSTDGGNSWIVTAGLGSALEFSDDIFMASTGTALIITDVAGNIFRSVDGITWVLNATSTFVGITTLNIVADATHVIILSQDTVYTSFDDGLTYSSAVLGDGSKFISASLLDGTTVATQEDGTTYSTIDGITWTAGVPLDAGAELFEVRGLTLVALLA